MTLVYISSIGRPTVVDLDTGAVSEVLVADTRAYDRILVEDGQVVTTDPERGNLGPAGDQAVVFHLHRPSAEAGVVADGEVGAIGPHLCLDLDGCPIDGCGGEPADRRRPITAYVYEPTAGLERVGQAADELPAHLSGPLDVVGGARPQTPYEEANGHGREAVDENEDGSVRELRFDDYTGRIGLENPGSYGDDSIDSEDAADLYGEDDDGADRW